MKLASILWRSSPNTVQIATEAPVEVLCAHIEATIHASKEFQGKVLNRGIKIWRSRYYAQSRNTFAPILYGVISPGPQGSQIDAHFQLNPVMRLFLVVWFTGTVTLALLSLLGGLLRATPDSNAGDAIPYMVPMVLPLIGWGILRWQQRRGEADELRIKEWLTNVATTGLAQPQSNEQRDTSYDRDKSRRR